MTNAEDALFADFSKAFERWGGLPRPENFGCSHALTYPIELDLDHVVTYLRSLGNEAAQRDTRIDWPNIVPEYLADLDAIETNLDALSISEEEKRTYHTYICECRLVWNKMGTLPVPSEGHLGFRKAVLGEFRFLENDFDFRVARSSPIEVRYESSALFVELAYSPDCPELGLTVGRQTRNDEDKEAFYLDDITYMAGKGSFDFKNLDLKTTCGVASFVKSAADVVRVHLRDVLRNDLNAFKLLTDMAGERDKRYSEQMERRHGRDEGSRGTS